MKSEEIEQLLAAYINGEVSITDRQQLEELFKQKTELKQEAQEMLKLWQSLGKVSEYTQPPIEMDMQFYTMLQRVKKDQTAPARMLVIKKTLLKAAAAIIICITAFGIGRFTALPGMVYKYKTVYVKQPVYQQQMAKPVGPSANIVAFKIQHKSLIKNRLVKDSSELTQQLRSVYASERIGAVMKITGRENLNNADLQALELALREDPSPNVRLTILDALRPLAAQQSVQAVLINALKQQNDELIESSIIDLLIDNKSKQAIPQMIAMLSDKNTDLVTQSKIKAGIESFLN